MRLPAPARPRPGGGLFFRDRIAFPPFAKETDRQSSKHAQNPAGIAVPDARAIFLGRDIQSLVKTVLDAPVLALGPEPGGGIEVFVAGEQISPRFRAGHSDVRLVKRIHRPCCLLMFSERPFARNSSGSFSLGSKKSMLNTSTYEHPSSMARSYP